MQISIVRGRVRNSQKLFNTHELSDSWWYLNLQRYPPNFAVPEPQQIPQLPATATTTATVTATTTATATANAITHNTLLKFTVSYN